MVQDVESSINDKLDERTEKRRSREEGSIKAIHRLYPRMRMRHQHINEEVKLSTVLDFLFRKLILSLFGDESRACSPT